MASADRSAAGIVDRMRLFVDAVDEYAIFMLDPDGRVVTWNAGAQRIKGYRADEIIGRHFSTFYTPDDIADGKPQRHLAVAFAVDHVRDEGWRVRKDGTRFWATVVISKVFDSDGNLEGFAKITRDDTDHRVASEREQLLAVISERERISIALCDTIVRRIFSASLTLQGALGFIDDINVSERVVDAMTQLDDTLREIRNTLAPLRPHAD